MECCVGKQGEEGGQAAVRRFIEYGKLRESFQGVWERQQLPWRFSGCCGCLAAVKELTTMAQEEGCVFGKTDRTDSRQLRKTLDANSR